MFQSALAEVEQLAATPSAAHTGRTEINQTLVDAAGGFPYVPTLPGNYVLTSDLVVTADVSAIVLDPPLGARGMRFDLNGFAIQGASGCGSVCTEGAADGVASTLFRAAGSAVVDGTRLPLRVTPGDPRSVPFKATSEYCRNPRPVWCVEDRAEGIPRGSFEVRERSVMASPRGPGSSDPRRSPFIDDHLDTVLTNGVFGILVGSG